MLHRILAAILVALVAVPTASATTARHKVGHDLTRRAKVVALNNGGQFTKATCEPLVEEPPGASPHWWTYCHGTLVAPGASSNEEVYDVEWLVWISLRRCKSKYTGLAEDFSGRVNLRIFKRIRCVKYLPTGW